MFLIIIIAIILFFVVLIAYGKNKEKKNNEILTEQGYSVDKKIVSGKYLAGHPEIDNPVNSTTLFFIDKKLVIMQTEVFEEPKKLAEIYFDKISNITIEDKTTIEKRVTVTRLLLTGIFAFALKKNKKTEVAYLVIDWNDDKFNHETIFEYTNKEAMQSANTARNALIKLVK
jgi:hypothetical protein